MVIFIDAIISPAGTGLIYVTATSRISYGLQSQRVLPEGVRVDDEAGRAVVGLVTAFVVGCACFAPFPSWQGLVSLITSASVLMYAGAPLALGAFRKRIPEIERPYRMPAAAVLSPVAFIVANLIILWTGWDTDWKLGVAILIGAVVIILNNVFRGASSVRPRWDWKAAQWLLPYLIGMGLIVFLSDFGPLTHPLFPLWIDIVVVAVFSLVIYYWAISSASDRAEILRTADDCP
ncbi:hypothetical protein QP157_12395 [Sphingomonas sp. LR61]|uniref:hypothetical protein n=1 Tax=Sphingomonas sp. LR61 TaxID=3050234 RepID=UPI002FE137FB